MIEPRRAALGALLLLAAAGCGGAPAVRPDPPSAPLVKSGAFPQGDIEVATLERAERQLTQVIVAVLPFHGPGAAADPDRTGALLADLISAQLAARPGLKVVERQRIGAVFDELRLSEGAMVDQETAVRIGNLLGANTLVLGSFARMGERGVLTMRLVKVETGEIVGGVTERGGGAAAWDVLAEQAAARLFDALKRGG
ncbi:MAG: hypothetical protein HY927_15110 [Elusimicrobia bacterium]|nr:hypothetical protein [Elusimicrobiota bacterium]